MLRNDSTSRSFWKLATVEELLPGRDGKIRAAIVRTTDKSLKPQTLRRVIEHLIPLEVRANKPKPRDTPVTQENVESESQTRSRRAAAVIGELLRRERADV